jgi:hypothetical protein
MGGGRVEERAGVPVISLLAGYRRREAPVARGVATWQDHRVGRGRCGSPLAWATLAWARTWRPRPTRSSFPSATSRPRAVRESPAEATSRGRNTALGEGTEALAFLLRIVGTYEDVPTFRKDATRTALARETRVLPRHTSTTARNGRTDLADTRRIGRRRDTRSAAGPSARSKGVPTKRPRRRVFERRSSFASVRTRRSARRVPVTRRGLALPSIGARMSASRVPVARSDRSLPRMRTPTRTRRLPMARRGLVVASMGARMNASRVPAPRRGVPVLPRRA